MSIDQKNQDIFGGLSHTSVMRYKNEPERDSEHNHNVSPTKVKLMKDEPKSYLHEAELKVNNKIMDSIVRKYKPERSQFFEKGSTSSKSQGDGYGLE